MTAKPGAKRAASPWARDRAAEREAKREAVLHAAAEAFAANGYHRTALDDIAERLGITKPILYYYARNKEDLIVEVGVRALDRIIVAFDEADPASGLDRLKQLLHRYGEVIATDFGKCLAELSEGDLGAEAAQRIHAGKARIGRQIRELLQAGIDDGSIAPCDVRMTSFILGGAINGIARWYREGGDLSPAAVAQIYVDQLSAGLSPR